MAKEYQFVCLGCGTLFTTTMIDRAYCRMCISAGKTSLGAMPVPSPMQASKWKRAREAKRLLDERAAKIERHAQRLEV